MVHCRSLALLVLHLVVSAVDAAGQVSSAMTVEACPWHLEARLWHPAVKASLADGFHSAVVLHHGAHCFSAVWAVAVAHLFAVRQTLSAAAVTTVAAAAEMAHQVVALQHSVVVPVSVCSAAVEAVLSLTAAVAAAALETAVD